MKKNFLRTLPVIVLVLVLVLFSCNTPIPENGKLPKDYAWAYGAWRFETHDGFIDIFIGGDYFQFIDNSNWLRDYVPNLGEYYPVYTSPKKHFYIKGDSEFRDYYTVGDDKIVMELDYPEPAVYEGEEEWYYVVFLNKEHKEVSLSWEHCISCKKLEMEVDESVIKEYNDALESSPIYGDWKEIEWGDKRTIQPSDNFVLMKNGDLIEQSLSEGCTVYKYDAYNDMITGYFFGQDTWVEKLKRYDKKQERQEELARKEQERINKLVRAVEGKSFSHYGEAMPWLSNSIASSNELVFMSNGRGITRLYSINRIGEYRLASEDYFTWSVAGDKVVVYNLTQEGDVDYFNVEQNVFGTSLTNGYDSYSQDKR